MIWTSRWIFLGCTVEILLACGGDSSNGNAGGRSHGSAGDPTTAGTAGTRPSNGGNGGSSNVSGGAMAAGTTNGNTGGTTAGGANAGGTSASSGAASNGGKTFAVKSCNPANVLCDMAEPVCPSMQVPELSASGNCYTGACMPIGDCSCRTPSDCPDRNQYTCRNDTQRCTPYL